MQQGITVRTGKNYRPEAIFENQQDGVGYSKIRNVCVAFSEFLSQFFLKNRKMRQMRWAARALDMVCIRQRTKKLWPRHE